MAAASGPTPTGFAESRTCAVQVRAGAALERGLARALGSAGEGVLQPLHAAVDEAHASCARHEPQMAAATEQLAAARAALVAMAREEARLESALDLVDEALARRATRMLLGAPK
jgi:hypothetical protein